MEDPVTAAITSVIIFCAVCGSRKTKTTLCSCHRRYICVKCSEQHYMRISDKNLGDLLYSVRFDGTFGYEYPFPLSIRKNKGRLFENFMKEHETAKEILCDHHICLHSKDFDISGELYSTCPNLSIGMEDPVDKGDVVKFPDSVLKIVFQRKPDDNFFRFGFEIDYYLINGIVNSAETFVALLTYGELFYYLQHLEPAFGVFYDGEDPFVSFLKSFISVVVENMKIQGANLDIGGIFASRDKSRDESLELVTSVCASCLTSGFTKWKHVAEAEKRTGKKKSKPKSLHKTCGGCEKTCYCSETCRLRHWSCHKPRCSKKDLSPDFIFKLVLKYVYKYNMNSICCLICPNVSLEFLYCSMECRRLAAKYYKLFPETPQPVSTIPKDRRTLIYTACMREVELGVKIVNAIQDVKIQGSESYDFTGFGGINDEIVKLKREFPWYDMSSSQILVNEFVEDHYRPQMLSRFLDLCSLRSSDSSQSVAASAAASGPAEASAMPASVDGEKLYACSGPGCTKKTNVICTGCRTVYYCSVDCQKADWKSHKTLCKEKRVAQTSPASVAASGPAETSTVPASVDVEKLHNCSAQGCTKKTDKLCPICDSVYYCSDECYRGDKENHKDLCKAYRSHRHSSFYMRARLTPPASSGAAGGGGQ